MGLQSRLTRNGITQASSLRFLDVGCANGEYLKTALDLGFSSASGIEIDQTARAKASAFGQVVTDAEALLGQSFDVIQVKNVLSNIRDPLLFMRAQLRLLSPSGILFIDVLNQDALTADLRNSWARLMGQSNKFSPLRPPYVINGFTPRALELLTSQLNLNTAYLETSYMGSPVVPYAPGRPAMLLGRLGTVFGKGSMIIGDFRATPH